MSAVLSKNTARTVVAARQATDPLSLKDLETQFDELTAPKTEEPTGPSAADIAALKAKLTGFALIGTLEQQYLHHALGRATEPMHPNFVAALKKREGALEEAQLQRTVIVRAFDAGAKSNAAPKAIVLGVLKAFDKNLPWYIAFLKDTMKSVAFAVHMDVIAHTKRLATGEFDATGLDAMEEEHPADPNDVPVFDAAEARPFEREPYAGGTRPEPIASSTREALDALRNIQAWLSLAVANIDGAQRTYWGVDGLIPLDQRKDAALDGSFVYTPIFGYDDYVVWQKESFRRKRSVVNADSALDLMAQA